MKKILLLVLFCNLLAIQSDAQVPSPVNSGEILLKLHKLKTLGNALYIAAHPDDENTRLISYLSNVAHVDANYLSLTRGDGGQNMIGTHIGEDLGIIRTQELLSARKIDNGNQFFTRAVDFGYSKTSKETLEFWGEEEVLADVVRVIRICKPDIIINRFDEDDKRTHGHHRASAILSLKAFELASDPNAFPEQLEELETWQAKRVYYNTSWWRYGSREAFDSIDKSEMLSIDVGAYSPLLGESMTEVAARSRSRHKSQGFGSAGRRGHQEEWLELKRTDGSDRDMSDLFGKRDLSWNRIARGRKIATEISNIISEFDPGNPENSLDALFALKKEISELSEGYWKQKKLRELDEIIGNCAGIYFAAFADKEQYVPSDSMNLNLELTVRLSDEFSFESISIPGRDENIEFGARLPINQRFDVETYASIPDDPEYSCPYWLREEGGYGLYKVKDESLIGAAEEGSTFIAEAVVSRNNGEEIHLTAPVEYRYTDRVRGEVRTPIAIVPEQFLLPSQDIYLMRNGEEKTLSLTIKNMAKNARGKVHLSFIGKDAELWKFGNSARDVSFSKIGEEHELEFKIRPPKTQSTVKTLVEWLSEDGQKRALKTLSEIEYDHIPKRNKVHRKSITCVHIPIAIKGKRIAYLMGAGDKVPEAIRQMGYQLDLLEDGDIDVDNLMQYDAVVTGIRAYNTVDRIGIYNEEFLEYVKRGGTLIVQYNTTWGLDVEPGPYPIEFSRERVTEEDATVEILAPEHPVFDGANKIILDDFEGWVQERGLYFASDWDERYTPLLSCHDKGDDALKGGMLYAPYGEGHFVYTGYSWFRELPAGVPGAYKLFANLLSLGNAE